MRILMVALCAALLMAAGCSPQRELTFHVGGTPNEIDQLEELLQDFETETGIAVTLLRSTTQTEQRKQSILIALRGRKPDPDVVLMDVAWIGQMASSGWLAPLDGYGIDRSAFFPRIIDLADTHQGKLIGVPLYVDGGLLYYRTDLLERHGYEGPPRTWDELVAMSKKIQRAQRESNPDFWGYVWQGAQYEGLICNALEVFTSAGGGFFDSEMNPMVDAEPNVKGLRFMSDLINTHRISPPNTYTEMKEDEARLLFQNGSALFERNWPYAWALHNEEGSKVKGRFGIAPLPYFEGHTSASALGGWHIGLSKFSDRKEDAARFIEYMTSYEVQKKLAMKLAWNPGRMDVYDDKELNEAYGVLAGLKKVFRNAVPRPVVPYYSQVSVVLQRHINAALAGKVAPEEALDEAQQEARNVIAQYER